MNATLSAMLRISGTLLLVLLCVCAKADVVILQNGKTVVGKVLQQDAEGVLLQMDYGTARYDKAYVKNVEKERVESDGESSLAQRIPNWSRLVSALATNAWAHDLKQIPATVIDTGILKNVPYISFRCGGGYEINIYGDLDNPAGFEIGAITYLAKHEPAKTNCLNFVAAALTANEDKNIVRRLNLKNKDTKKRDGVDFEITLPDEPDAYGGWWISVYDQNLLAKSRASGNELLAITQPKEEPKFRQATIPIQTTVANTDSVPGWSSSDISYSRPRISSSNSGSGGGRVYVSGYYRKNGTYVRAHTRSSPRRR